MIEPGDVVTAYLPGVSATKRRPAVVISTPAYHSERPDVLLALITSQVEKAETSFDTPLYAWQQTRLQLPSTMRSFLFTKPAQEVIKIGHLTDADWSDVQARLRHALAIPWPLLR